MFSYDIFSAPSESQICEYISRKVGKEVTFFRIPALDTSFLHGEAALCLILPLMCCLFHLKTVFFFFFKFSPNAFFGLDHLLVLTGLIKYSGDQKC